MKSPMVQRALGVVAAVAELTGDAELVLSEAPLGRLVLGRGRAVEEVELVGAVLDSVAEDVDGAAFGDFALEAGQGPCGGWGSLRRGGGRGRCWVGSCGGRWPSWMRSTQYSRL